MNVPIPPPGLDLDFDRMMMFDFDLCGCLVPDSFRPRQPVPGIADESGAYPPVPRPTHNRLPLPLDGMDFPSVIYSPTEDPSSFPDLAFASGLDEEDESEPEGLPADRVESGGDSDGLCPPNPRVPPRVVSIADLHPSARTNILRRLEWKAFDGDFGDPSEFPPEALGDPPFPEETVEGELDETLPRKPGIGERVLMEMFPASRSLVGRKRRRSFKQPFSYSFLSEGGGPGSSSPQFELEERRSEGESSEGGGSSTSSGSVEDFDPSCWDQPSMPPMKRRRLLDETVPSPSPLFNPGSLQSMPPPAAFRPPCPEDVLGFDSSPIPLFPQHEDFAPFDGLEFPSFPPVMSMMGIQDQEAPFASPPGRVEISNVEISANGGRRSIYVRPTKLDLYLRKNKMVRVVMEYCDPVPPRSIQRRSAVSPTPATDNLIVVELVNVERRHPSGWASMASGDDAESFIEPSKKGYLGLETSDRPDRFRVVMKMKINNKVQTGGSVTLRLTYRFQRGHRMWHLYYVFTVDAGNHNAKKLSRRKVSTSLRLPVPPRLDHLNGEMFQYFVTDRDSCMPIEPFDLMSYSHFTPSSSLVGKMVYCCGGGLDVGVGPVLPLHQSDPDAFWTAFGLTRRNWSMMSNLIPSPHRRRRVVVWVMATGLSRESPPFSLFDDKVRLIQTSPTLHAQQGQQDLATHIVELFRGHQIVFFDMTNGSSPTIREIAVAFQYLRLFAEKHEESVNIIGICPWVYSLPGRCEVLQTACGSLPKNVFVSCAAGNSGQLLRYGRNWLYPICCSSSSKSLILDEDHGVVLSVGAYDVHGKGLRSDSNSGEMVHLSAPATSTSYACIYVALMTSIIWCVKPSQTPAKLTGVLVDEASVPMEGDCPNISSVGSALTSLVQVRIGLDRQLADLGCAFGENKDWDIGGGGLVLEEESRLHTLMVTRQLPHVKNELSEKMRSLTSCNAQALRLEYPKCRTLKLKTQYCLSENKVDVIAPVSTVVAQGEPVRVRLPDDRPSDLSGWMIHLLGACCPEDVLSCACMVLLSRLEIPESYDHAFAVFRHALTECVRRNRPVEIDSEGPDRSLASALFLAWAAALDGRFDEAIALLGSDLHRGVPAGSGCALTLNLSLALFLSSRGQFDEAIETYKQSALLSSPNSTQALVSLGLLSEIVVDDPIAALQSYTLALEKDPLSVDALFARGNLYFFRLDQCDRAEADYQTCLVARRDNPSLLLNFSLLLHTRLNNRKEAASLVCQGLRLDPKSKELHWNKAMFDFSTGRLEESLESCEFFAADPHSPHDNDEFHYPVLNLRAVISATTVSFEAAFALLSTSLTGMPSEVSHAFDDASSPLSNCAAAEMLNNYSLLMGSKKLWEKALSLIEAAIGVDSDCSELYSNRGVALLKLGRRAEALEDFSVAIRKNPYNYLAYKNRGIFFQKTGSSLEAFLDFNSAFKIEPSDPTLLLLRGISLISLDARCALRDLNRFLKLRPKSSRGYFFRSVATLFAGPPCLRAIGTDLDTAIELDPSFALALNNRGYLASKMAQLEDARKDLDKAISCRPNYANAHFNRANLLADYGDDFDLALQDYSKCIELSPRTAMYYLRRGRLHLTMGNDDLAEADTKSFMSLVLA